MCVIIIEIGNKIADEKSWIWTLMNIQDKAEAEAEAEALTFWKHEAEAEAS